MFGKKEKKEEIQTQKTAMGSEAVAENKSPAERGGDPTIEGTAVNPGGAAASETVSRSTSNKNGNGNGNGSLKKKKKRRRRRRIAIVLVIVLAIAVLYVRGTMGGGEMLYPVPTAEVTAMDLEQVVSIKGTVEGVNTAEVASSENREITAIHVKEGDLVRQGQLLASIKPEDPEEDLDNQKPYNREQAVRNMETAKFDYEAMQTLYDEGAASYQDLLKAEAAYENSLTLIDSYDAPKLTKSSKTTIESPINGTITRVNAKVGLLANDSQNIGSLFVIEDLSRLQMNVKATEYNISKIRVGQTVEITAEVMGKDVAYGVVSYIAPTGETKDMSGNEMVIPVTIDITDVSNVNLIAGVSAKANILIDSAEDTMAVPIDAIMLDPATGGQYMFVAENGILRKVAVETGLESDFYIQIVSGELNIGDRYVTSPSYDMEDGMPVMDLNLPQEDQAGGEE